MLGALAAPVYTKVFMGATIDVNMLHMFKQIVPTAQEGNFDLIIMGTHGHGKMEERVIGSTASDVIRLSYIPVTVIRLPETTPMTTHRQAHGKDLAENPSRPVGKNNQRLI